MARVLTRLITNVARRQLQLPAAPVARYCQYFNDPVDHATGLEKKELLAKLAGNDDPYHMKAIKRGVGTKEKPTLIPSAFDARIVGCICHEDQTWVQWFWLYKDVPKRCECGHWYKLQTVEPFVDINF